MLNSVETATFEQYKEIMPPLDRYNQYQLPAHSSYPQRSEGEGVYWSYELIDYDPIYHVDIEVLNAQGRWADSEYKHFRQENNSIVFEELFFDSIGRALNPIGRTGIAGRGKLGRWGANIAVDGIVTRDYLDKKQVLLIQRDTGVWAFPGGFYEGGEYDEEAAREVLEETHIKLDPVEPELVSPGAFVFSSRMTDHAWIETVVHKWHLPDGLDTQIPLAADDACDAKWADIDSDFVRDNLTMSHYGLLIPAGLR